MLALYVCLPSPSAMLLKFTYVEHASFFFSIEMLFVCAHMPVFVCDVYLCL